MLFEILFLTYMEQCNARYSCSVDLRYPGNEEYHSNFPCLKLSQHSVLIN